MKWPDREERIMSDDTSILRQLLNAYNDHDADGVAACFSDDAVFEAPSGPGPAGRMFVGKAAIREVVATRFISSPDVHWEEESHFRSGDRGASSWIVTWTNPDGSGVALRGCDLFTLRGELLTRKDSFFKTAITTN
jgi:ketosteroid isomerase-like protein